MFLGVDFKEMREPIKKLARKLSSHEFIEAEMLDTNKTINSFYDEHYDFRFILLNFINM